MIQPATEFSESKRKMLFTAGTAIGLGVALFDSAFANDCAEYVKNLKNFAGIPKGLMEDCMRTGYVQAIATAVTGMIGGAAIADAVNKALTDALKGWKEPGIPGQPTTGYTDGREGPPKDNPWDPSDADKRAKWEKEKVVWDPSLLKFRPPTPEEYPPPDNPPEDAPPYQKQNPRSKTPPACLGLYDDYVRAEADLLGLEPQMNKLRDELRLAQDWLQLKLGLFTAQFAVDMTDFFQLGVAGVKAAGPISQVIGRAGTISEIARAAARKAARLAKAAMELLKEIAALGARVVKLRSAVEVMAETAKFLARHADEMAEAILALDKRVAANRRLLTIAAEIESDVAKRGTVVAKLMAAESKLKAAEMMWQRRQQLQRWAEGERVSITTEQARLALDAKAELSAIEEEIRQLQAKVAQSPEVTEAARRTSKATTTLNDIDERIRQLEAHAQELSRKLEAAEAKVAAGRAKIQQAEAIEAKIAEIDGAKTLVEERKLALERADANLAELESQPAFKNYEAELEAVNDPAARARGARIEAENRLARADAAEHQLREEMRAEITRLGGDFNDMDSVDLLPPDRLKQYRERNVDITKEIAEAKAEYDRAAEVSSRARQDALKGRAELEAKHSALLEKRSDLEVEINKGRAALQEAETDYTAKSGGDARYHENRVEKLKEDARQLRQGGEAAKSPARPDDPEAPAVLEEERNLVRQELKQKRGEIAEARKEFNEAYQAEERVKAEFETSTKSALEAKKTAAEAKLRRAERDWQQVAAERPGSEFQDWKLEVEGTDPLNEGPKELQPLHEEVLDLKKQEAEVEKSVNAKRDQLGGETPESVQQKIAEDEAALTEKRREHAAAKEKAQTSKSEVDKAQKEVVDAEAKLKAKETELENMRAQESEANAEYKREAGSDAPPPDALPDEVSPLGKGTADAIDALTQASHDLSEKFKPVAAKKLEDALKSAMGAFGAKWTEYFNGQSPDEVADGIKKSRDKVIRLKGELEAMQSKYDAARETLKTAKPKLDACITENTRLWTGPSHEGGTSNAGTP